MVSTAIGSGNDSLQSARANHDEPLGTTNGTECSLAVADGVTIASDVAPHDGMVIVFLPSGTFRVRMDVGAVATANDPAYIGPWVWHWEITGGERVSLRGDASSGTATVCMAK